MTDNRDNYDEGDDLDATCTAASEDDDEDEDDDDEVDCDRETQRARQQVKDTHYDPNAPNGSRRKSKVKKAKTVKRIAIIPTGTALLARTPVFLPVRFTLRAKSCVRRYRTPWGRVKISGPLLTQTHRDLFEALLKLRGKDSKTRVVYYTMADLRGILGRRIEHKYRKRILKDLSEAKIKLEGTNKNGDVEFEAMFRVVDSYAIIGRRPKVKLFGRKSDPVTDPEQRYRVRLGEEFLGLFAKDITLSYPRYVPLICRAKHAPTKAVIRFLLSHNKAHYRERKLFRILGANRKDDNARMHRALVEDAEVLKAIGVQHDADARRLKYRRDKSRVFVQTPAGRERTEE